jgi:hypothetical protein
MSLLLIKNEKKIFGSGSPASFPKEPDAKSRGSGGRGRRNSKRIRKKKVKFACHPPVRANLLFIAPGLKMKVDFNAAIFYNFVN